MVAPESIADRVINALAKAFSPPLPKELIQLFLTKIQPAIRAALGGVKLSSADEEDLRDGLIGTVIKLLWAFTWQEEVFQYSALYTETWNTIGSHLTPTVNAIANKITGFTHPDESLQQDHKVYPGQSKCSVNKTAPHAKWHTQSANALFDLAYLCDKVNKFTANNGTHQLGAAVKDDDSKNQIISMDRFETLVESVLSGIDVTGRQTAEAFFAAARTLLRQLDALGHADGIITWHDLAVFLESQVDSSISWKEHFAQAVMGKIDSDRIIV